MGYRPVPEAPEFAGSCLPAFPADKKPRQLIAVFSGIQPCDKTGPLPYPAIPTNVLLTASGTCVWSASLGADWFCRYLVTAGSSGLLLSADDGNIAFIGSSADPTQTGFGNNADCNFPHTYMAEGGFGSVVWTADVRSSVQAVCELMGFPLDLETKFDVTPIDETHNMFHFYRKGWARDYRIEIDMDDL